MSTRNYKDFSLIFNPHPVTGDVICKNDSDAVKQSIRNLVLTMNYERPFHPEKGCPIYSILFDLTDDITKQIAKTAISNIISQYEKRANLIDIQFDLIDHGVNIIIYFAMANTEVVEQVSIFVNRLR